MENSILQELNAEAERIIGNRLLPAKSRKRYEHVYKLFTEWQSEKNKICLWNILSSFRDSRGAPPPEPPAGASPLDPTGAAPRTPSPPSCTPSPIPPITACQQ